MADNLGIPEITQNPFLADTVIVRFLAKANNVSNLKKLRKMNIKWNHLNIKELGKRASILGHIKPIDLSVEFYQEKIDEFFDSTLANPKIFRSFRLDFASIKDNYALFSKYSPISLQLYITSSTDYKEVDQTTLHLFLALIAPKIQDLKIHFNPRYDGSDEGALLLRQNGHYQGPVFPKLTRFSCIVAWSLFDSIKFILNRGGEVDHTPRLTALEIKFYNREANPFLGTVQLTPAGISRWSKLTHLTMICDSDKQIQITTSLRTLGQGGMRLESLDFNLKHPDLIDWIHICENLSEFFQTQSKSFKILQLICFCHLLRGDIANTKIRLPTFEVLHTLRLLGNYNALFHGQSFQVGSRFLEMASLPVNFPKLNHLEIDNCQLLASFFPVGVPTPPMHLETLYIYHLHQRGEIDLYSFAIWEKTFELLGERFKSVVRFRTNGSLLQERFPPKSSCVKSVCKFLGMAKVDGRKLAWKESLKVLEIFDVKAPLHLSHLKGLEELVVIESKIPQNADEYLSLFKNVRRLKLSKISFTFGDMHFSDQIQNLDKIALYFRCPVLFL